MMRSLLVVLSLLVVCAVCSQTVRFPRYTAQPQVGSASYCNKTTCVQLGQGCGLYANCINGTYCSQENRTCVLYLGVGANCTSSMDCIYGNCVAGTCMAENYRQTPPGEKCTNSSECSLVAGVPTSGQCLNNRCFGYMIGQKCHFNESYTENSCINSYCNNKTGTPLCAAYRLSNQTCDAEDLCAEPLVCNSICRYPSVSVEGGACSVTDDCAAQLFCGSNKICQPSTNITLAACNATTPCSNGLVCTCFQDKGESQCWTALSSGTLSAEIALQKCLELNNCTTRNYTLSCVDAGLCVTEHCNQWTSAQNQLELYNPVTAQCLLDSQRFDTYSAYLVQYCAPVPAPSDDGFPTWAIVLIVIAGIVVLAALAYFVYVKTSKRDQYSAIEHR